MSFWLEVSEYSRLAIRDRTDEYSAASSRKLTAFEWRAYAEASCPRITEECGDMRPQSKLTEPGGGGAINHNEAVSFHDISTAAPTASSSPVPVCRYSYPRFIDVRRGLGQLPGCNRNRRAVRDFQHNHQRQPNQCHGFPF